MKNGVSLVDEIMKHSLRFLLVSLSEGLIILIPQEI